MTVLLIRSDRYNYDFGELKVKYKTWIGEIVDEYDDESDIERAFCEVEINGLKDFLELYKKFGELIFNETDDSERRVYKTNAKYIIRIYD